MAVTGDSHTTYCQCLGDDTNLGLVIRHDLDEHQECSIGAQQAAITAVLMLLLNVAAYALDGFADAAEIQVGQSIGQGQPETVRLALRSTAWCSGFSALAASIGLFFASDAWVWLLVPQPEIANAIQPWLGYVIPLPLVAWISYWLDGVFLGAGAFKQMAKVMLASTGAFFPLQLLWGYDRPLERLYPMATDPSRPDVLGLLEQAKNPIIS